jgi:hypothetical protein
MHSLSGWPPCVHVGPHEKITLEGTLQCTIKKKTRVSYEGAKFTQGMPIFEYEAMNESNDFYVSQLLNQYQLVAMFQDWKWISWQYNFTHNKTLTVDQLTGREQVKLDIDMEKIPSTALAGGRYYFDVVIEPTIVKGEDDHRFDMDYERYYYRWFDIMNYGFFLDLKGYSEP